MLWFFMFPLLVQDPDDVLDPGLVDGIGQSIRGQLDHKPEQRVLVVGRAQVIFFSVAEGERAWEVWRWPWSVRWSRLFSIVR